MRGGEAKKERKKRTNALDFNKELSQQIVWPYIKRAGAMGDLPTWALNTALLQPGPPRDS